MKRLFLLGLLFISISANAAILPSTKKVEFLNPGDSTTKIGFTVKEKSKVALSFSGAEVRNPSSEYYRFKPFSDWSLANKNGVSIASGGWVTDESYHGGRDCSSEDGCQVNMTRSTRDVELEAGTYEVTYNQAIHGGHFSNLEMDFNGVGYTINPSPFSSAINLAPGAPDPADEIYTVSFTLSERKEVELKFWGTVIMNHPHDYTTYRGFSDWHVNQNGGAIGQGSWSLEERFYYPPKWSELDNHPWTPGQDCTSWLHCEVTQIRSSGWIALDPGTYEVTFDMPRGNRYDDGVMDFLGVFTKQGNDPSACEITYTLPSNQWRQISLPCDPGANNSVSAVFGDDIQGQYGTEWILYKFNTQTNSYGEALKLTDSVEQGKGYWITQITGEAVTLKMPPGSTEAAESYQLQLASASGSDSTQWTLSGNPFSSALKLGDFSLKTESGICSSSPCDLDMAKTEKLLHNQVWVYDGKGYTKKDTQEILNAWDGFWVASLEKSKGRALSLVDLVKMECQFYDQEEILIGDGKYTYDPSVSDSFSYRISSGEEKVFDTYYATEFHPNITLPAAFEWTGGDYQLTDVITDIWAGDKPGTLMPDGGGSPFSSIVSGWKMNPTRCSGCDTRALYMDWNTPFEGIWSGEQLHQNNIDPDTGAFEAHSANGNFTCENSKINGSELKRADTN
jgi:hypothetical protein